MLITVMYRNGKVGMVEHSQLDALIKTRKIKQFMRAEGWVCIDTDPVRKIDNADSYCGPQRRQNIKFRR
ncbi:MAG: GSU3473 family protein [Nitrospirota bacterium]